MRAAILVLSFLPFIYFAAKDTAFHLRGRKVSDGHFARGNWRRAVGHVYARVRAIIGWWVAALVIFACAGGVDEYIFHRGILAEEFDLHAKEHLALLIFIVVSQIDWLEKVIGTVVEAERLRAALGRFLCDLRRDNPADSRLAPYLTG